MTKTLTPPATSEALEGFLADYEAVSHAGALDGTAALSALREQGIGHLREAGLPTTKQEDWRFTSVAPLAKVRFTRADGAAAVSLADYQALADLTKVRFVFVNGAYRPELSATAGLPAGVRAGSLKAALVETPELVMKHLGTANRFDQTPFTALNAAFMSDGFRPVNEGFSGGEKKRNEIFQMAVLEPTLAILDETDSGLDIDALQAVAEGVNALRSPDRAIVLVTHYQRLLNYIVPDFVHVLANGRIQKSGGKELALELEAKGYSWIEEAVGV